jgi:hypothetical protein
MSQRLRGGNLLVLGWWVGGWVGRGAVAVAVGGKF